MGHGDAAPRQARMRSAVRTFSDGIGWHRMAYTRFVIAYGLQICDCY